MPSPAYVSARHARRIRWQGGLSTAGRFSASPGGFPRPAGPPLSRPVIGLTALCMPQGEPYRQQKSRLACGLAAFERTTGTVCEIVYFMKSHPSIKNLLLFSRFSFAGRTCRLNSLCSPHTRTPANG